MANTQGQEIERVGDGLPLIIGLIGRKRVGKDTVGGILRNGYGYRRHAFADAMKDSLLVMDPLIRNDLRLAHFVNLLGWEGAKSIPEVRRTLQRYGDAVRLLDADAFCRPIEATLIRARRVRQPVVLTDVRRRNEALLVTAQGGVLVRITREGVEADQHISETDLDDYPVDETIRNDGSEADLTAMVRILLESRLSLL